MKSRKLTIIILFVLALIVTAGTYAYWANTINTPENKQTTDTVTVGEGQDVTTSLVLNENTTNGGILVPASQLSNSPTGSIDKVILSDDVSWIENSNTKQLEGTTSTANINVTISVTVTDKDGNDVTSLVAYLINVTPDINNVSSLILNASAKTFNYDITMSEPANQTEYYAIVNGTITVSFTYSLGTVITTDN